MTARLRQLNVLQPDDVLDVSPHDAAQLALHSGDLVCMRSRTSEATLPVCVAEELRPGELFTTFHSATTFVNRVTSPERDRITHTPEYKVTAVQLHKLAPGS